MKEIVITLILFLLIPATTFAEQYPDLGVKIETVADNLTIPWSIDWLPDGTAIFTERNGNLRIIQDGELLEEPLLTLRVGSVEGGMLGVTVDPNYSENGFIYLYYTYNEFISTSNKVVRYHLDGTELIENKILMEGIPGGPFHDGGRIQFGPDGKLYITTGDAGNSDFAQDLNSLAGKILRINSDGTIPEDNPFEDSPVYTFGHRNPQGIDWDKFGNLVATEHGPSGWRGNAHDEINVIIPGKNYGWPHVIGNETFEGAQNPILHTGDDTWAPSGAEFYDGDKIPQWNGKYFVATLRGSHLHMIDFDLQNNKVISHEKLFQDEYGRLRDVQTGPDGYLYILTSNQDGRGSPQINDDRILKISSMSIMVDSFEDCVIAGNPIMESYPRQCNSKEGINFIENVNVCNGISNSNPINVKTRVENWDSGVIIRVEGCVNNPDFTNGVDVTISDPNGEPVGSRDMIPQLDGSFTVFFEDQLNKEGEYLVIVESGNNLITTSFNIQSGTNVENTGIEIQTKEGFWQNYFDYGDTIFGEAYFFDGTIVPEKVNAGTVDIKMIKPSGATVIVAENIPITDNYVKFTIPITDDFKLGKYLLRAIYTINDVARIGDYEGRFYVAQEQHFTYSGEGGPLDVKAQYIEYDVSPIRFDIDKKSISFDFELLDGKFASDRLQFENDISLQIDRPLISPPYTIIIETEDDILEYQPKGYRIDIIGDDRYEYKLSLDEKWKKGTVTVIGTYVIPEFGSLTLIILTVSIISIFVVVKFLPKMQI